MFVIQNLAEYTYRVELWAFQKPAFYGHCGINNVSISYHFQDLTINRTKFREIQIVSKVIGTDWVKYLRNKNY